MVPAAVGWVKMALTNILSAGSGNADDRKI